MRRIGLILMLFGVSLCALAAWGLWRDVAWIAQPFYIWTWWGYILLADGFCAFRRGTSLLTTRWRLVPALCVASVTFWFFFELLNLRFQNWYYVGVFPGESIPGLIGGAGFVFLAFSTVFMGIFETIEALAAAGLWTRRKAGDEVPNGTVDEPGHAVDATVRFAPWVSYAVQALGAAMAFAAIVFPYYLAPLIWGSFTFLVDPWNYRRGGRSILRDFEVRDWGLIGRVFVAGLICGIIWESMNFFAPQKWIYTVRGLEELKLFEMPLLGFLGFPGLAFDSLAGYALLSTVFWGNRTWEAPGDLRYALQPMSAHRASWFWRSVPAQAFGWAFIAYFAMQTNIGSLELDLGDLGLRPTERRAMKAAGITRPRQLLRRAGDDAETHAALARTLHIDAPRLRRLLDRAALLSFKGIGRFHGDLLTLAGVRRVDDLCAWSAEGLQSRLATVAAAHGVYAPRLDIVRVWVLASRDRGGVWMLAAGATGE